MTSLFPVVIQAGQLYERGIPFSTGTCFYRPESTFSRDLSCLSAHLYRQQVGHLQVLDIMTGSGIRGIRQLEHAHADSIHCNDLGYPLHDTITENLRASAHARWPDQFSPSHSVFEQEQPPLLDSPLWTLRDKASNSNNNNNSTQQTPADGNNDRDKSVVITHSEASRLLMWLILQQKTQPDFIDADFFGAANLRTIIGLSLQAVIPGGLVCFACTAGALASGRDPKTGSALLNSELRHVPWANEQGIRALLGLAASEASARRLRIEPLWSLFSPHGPVYRCMVRVTECGFPKESLENVGYIRHDGATGHTEVVSWEDLVVVGPRDNTNNSYKRKKSRRDNSTLGKKIVADNNSDEEFESSSRKLKPETERDLEVAEYPTTASGPIWIGPLHSHQHVVDMHQEAAQRGWLDDLLATSSTSDVSFSEKKPRKGKPKTKKGAVLTSLDELLELMKGECCSESLTPWHWELADIAKWGRLSGPPGREKLLKELNERGFVAVRTQFGPKTLKTNADITEIVEAAKAIQKN